MYLHGLYCFEHNLSADRIGHNSEVMGKESHNQPLLHLPQAVTFPLPAFSPVFTSSLLTILFTFVDNGNHIITSCSDTL
jgi:hypothetical protein